MSIVVGYIDTPEGQAAMQAAVAEAKLRDAPLVVVNSQRGGREADTGERETAEVALAEIQRELEREDVECRIRQLVRGQDPADDLIAVAQEEGAQLIVIGLRRRSPVGKLIMGSNAQTVLLEAPCAVLAVKSS